MRDCGVSKVPSEIGNLVSLVEIDISRNTFRTLPDSLSNLYQLKRLCLERCAQLRSLPLLPSNLERVEAEWCSSLNLMTLNWNGYRRCIFDTKACKESSFSKPLVIAHKLEKNETSDWFTYQIKGDFLSLVAPAHLDNKICGFILYTHGRIFEAPKLLNKTKNTSRCLEEINNPFDYPHIMFYPLDDTTLVMEAGDTMTIDFTQTSLFECKLRLIYDCDMMGSKLVLQNVNGTPHTNGDYDSDDSDWDHGSDDSDST